VTQKFKQLFLGIVIVSSFTTVEGFILEVREYCCSGGPFFFFLSSFLVLSYLLLVIGKKKTGLIVFDKN
jgi:hypothetical protein